jgi:hypothetical protein
VGVDIDDADRPSGLHVSEVMAVRRLVPSAQDNGNRFTFEDCRDDCAERLLRFFQAPRDACIAHVKGRSGGKVYAASCIYGGEAAEPGPNLIGRLRGTDPAPIAANAGVLGKADEDRAARPDGPQVAVPVFDEFPEAGVVGAAARWL